MSMPVRLRPGLQIYGSLGSWKNQQTVNLSHTNKTMGVRVPRLPHSYITLAQEFVIKDALVFETAL